MHTCETFACPHCGARVKINALACPECGSDKDTGWSEDAYTNGLDLPTGYGQDDAFDYDEFIDRTFSGKQPKIAKLPAALVFLIVLAIIASLLSWLWH